jgi:hypothetical protein
LVLAAAALVCWLATMTSASATVLNDGDLRLGPWVLQGSSVLPSGSADQGLATVVPADGPPRLVTRGSGSVAPALRATEWTHIGDPSSFRGAVLDPYQTDGDGHAKVFQLTTRSGKQYTYVHALVPGEQTNNSFTAIAPGGRWFVSGEWGTMRRLLVFPMPHPGPAAASTPRRLKLATTIRLTAPMRDVQGCAFDSATSLVCSTNDPGSGLYGVARPLLVVHLTRPLDGRPVVGVPHVLGAAPNQTLCPGTGEVEGIDVFGNRLTLLVRAPCQSESQLFTFLRHHAGDPAPRWSVMSTSPVDNRSADGARETPVSGVGADGEESR